MITINKNEANNCFFTLNEKTTLSPAYYLLELVSKQNNTSKVVRLSGDTSTDTVRYNKFTITEVPSGSEDLDTANVYLESGEYDYFVWQSSATTLTLSAATSIVESGRFKVNGTGTTESTFTDTDTEYTFI